VCGFQFDEMGLELDVRGIVSYDAHISNGYAFDATKGTGREMGVRIRDYVNAGGTLTMLLEQLDSFKKVTSTLYAAAAAARDADAAGAAAIRSPPTVSSPRRSEASGAPTASASASASAPAAPTAADGSPASRKRPAETTDGSVRRNSPRMRT
jgi:hypothetical protein